VVEVGGEEWRALAYEMNGQGQTIALTFEREAGVSGWSLAQNQPNPFKEETTINFELPEAMPITLSIYNINGQLLWQRSGPYEKGPHQLVIEGAVLGASGLLIYSLQSADNQITKRMLRLP